MDCSLCGRREAEESSWTERPLAVSPSRNAVWCAFCAIDCGLALLKGRSLLGCNRRWEELSRYGQRWRQLVRSTGAKPPEGPTYRSLRAAAQRQFMAGRELTAESHLNVPPRVTYECLGTDRFVELGLLPSVDGSFVGVFATDVSRYVAMEHEIDVLQRALAERESASVPHRVVSEIAHDLRNLAGALSLQLALLERNPMAPQYREALRRTASEANAMLTRLESLAPRTRVSGLPLDFGSRASDAEGRTSSSLATR